MKNEEITREKTKKQSRSQNRENTLQEVKPKRNKFKKRFLLLYVACFAFTLYSAITIINQHIKINEKKEELSALKHQLEIVEIENKYLDEVKNYKGDDLNEYIEKIAREDLDYINNGERVFYIVSGD